VKALFGLLGELPGQVRAGFALALRMLTADPQVRSTALLAPIVLSLVSPLPYLGEVARDLPVTVVDLDRSDSSRRFTRLLASHEAVQLASLPSLAEAQTAFYRRQTQGIVLIPVGFERALHRGESSPLVTFSDASYLLVNRQVTGGVTDIANAATQLLGEYRLQGAGLSPQQAQAILAPIQVSVISLFNAAGSYAAYQVPALIVLIVQMTLLSAIGTGIGAAHEDRTNLGLARMGRLLGFMAVFTLTGVLLLSLLQLVMPHWYGYQSRASLAALLAVSLPFALATAAIGVVCGAWFRVREAASLTFVFLSLPLFMLAGYAWPAEAQPDWVRWLAQLSPSTAAIDAFIRLDQMGATLPDVRAELLWLWGMAAVGLCGAVVVHTSKRRD